MSRLHDIVTPGRLTPRDKKPLLPEPSPMKDVIPIPVLPGIQPRGGSDGKLDKPNVLAGLPASLQGDFLPDDILFALSQPQFPKENLAPESANLDTSTGPSKKRPANVWSHKRKEKFKHLTDNTACTCGAGNDISFLYDAPDGKSGAVRDLDPYDKSTVRVQDEQDGVSKSQDFKIPETLIPDEYHIVKNKGVLGLQYHENKYTVQPHDHEKHLTVFPSMKPASRYEVVQLKKAMGRMLEKAGVDGGDVKCSGPTQMHNLLELIKNEQKIYNIVFHELIRQVSVECVDRGELLAELRDKYKDLFTKVPVQMKSLHDEVLSQRSLDRRLTEELMRFQSSINLLTSELSQVKEHDQVVTTEAKEAQEDLKHALLEAQKNGNLLSEYHDLYELQRQRLEKQIMLLTEEKEIWSAAAYSLALKVTEENELVTAKRLHVNEKAWAKLSNHFTILLSDKDTEILTLIQSNVVKWRDLIEQFNGSMKRREDEMVEVLKGCQKGVQKWMGEFDKHCLSKDGHFEKKFDNNKLDAFLTDLTHWVTSLQHQADNFAGETFLTSEEALTRIHREMEEWTDHSMKVFGRHRKDDGKNPPDLDAMAEVNEAVETLLKQYHIRLTGENGVAQGIINLGNAFEIWQNKILGAMQGAIVINDSEWSKLNFLLEDWLQLVNDTLLCIGQTQKQDDRNDGKPHTKLEFQDISHWVQKWANSATNAIDSEDAKLVEQVSTFHSEMVQWMVQMLLRVAPDRDDHSDEAKHMAMLVNVPVNKLYSDAKSLFERLNKYSRYVFQCCDGFVMEEMLVPGEDGELPGDGEYKDLQQLKSECEQWIKMAKILMSQLTGEEVEVMFPVALKAQTSESTSDMSQVPDATYPELKAVKPPDRKITDDHAIDKPDRPPSGKDEEVSGKGQEVGEKVEVIGIDDNTHTVDLKERAEKTAHMKPCNNRPPTPDTRAAFEALAALETLQTQLIETEERAQEAEERANLTKVDLVACEEKVRELERQLNRQNREEQAPAAAKPAPVKPTPPVVTEPTPKVEVKEPVPEPTPTETKKKKPPRSADSRGRSAEKQKLGDDDGRLKSESPAPRSRPTSRTSLKSKKSNKS